MKTVLVTGGAGMIGSHVCEQLLANGHRVIAFDNLAGGRHEHVPHGARFVVGDICDEGVVDRMFTHLGAEVVLHAAAFASENLSPNCGLHTARSIVIGTQTLINAAVNHGVGVFVNLSSIAVYGDAQPPFSEGMYPFPCDNYGCAKLAAEGILRAAHHHFGLNSVTFRPHNCIGKNQSLADSTRNVASIFIRQALSGKPLTIFGDGEQTRAFSPVSHVAKIIAASVDRPETWNIVYNVGGNEVLQVKELAEIVSRLCGVPHRVEHLPERKEAKHAHSLHQRVAKSFPDLAKSDETVEECLTEMIAEARKNPLPEIKPLPPIEIKKNLNPAWTR